MDIKRDKKGFLDITDIVEYLDLGANYYDFDYKGEHYYFKRRNTPEEVYNELIAEEFAKEMGLPVCYSDIVNNLGVYGNISRGEIKKYDKTQTIYQLFEKHGINYADSYTLETIWEVFIKEYKDPNIVKDLMEQLVKIFIYDVLIVNPDRHCANLAIAEKDGIPSFYPLFDNELMATESTVKEEDYELSPDGFGINNQFKRFVEISASEYQDEIRKYLELINPNNIDRILDRVENKIGAKLPYRVREHVYFVLSLNYNHVNEVLDEEQTKTR